MTDATTTTVTFSVLEVERIHGAGRLVALAKVELELEGIVLTMQGVRVVRERNRVSTQAPRYRDPVTGSWLPAVVVPEELGQAIAAEVSRILAAGHRRPPSRRPAMG